MATSPNREFPKFESPVPIPVDPNEAIEFYRGVVAALAFVGLRGAKVVVAGEHLRAMSEGHLKQLAVDSAWGAIDLLRESQDPRLDEIASSLLRASEGLDVQLSVAKQDFRDLNS